MTKNSIRNAIESVVSQDKIAEIEKIVNSVNTDKETVSKIILSDEQTIRQFFFEECTPIFQYIIRKVFNYQVGKDELINEFYLYLREDDWHTLRQFEFRSKLRTWISVVAIRFFYKKRAELMINQHSEDLINEEIVDDFPLFQEDMKSLLSGLKSERYRYILQALMLEDRDSKEVADEIGITINYLYAIKCRALQHFKKIIEKEVGYAKDCKQ